MDYLNYSPDCANLLSAINSNQMNIKKIMKHSHQSEVMVSSPKGFLADFGPERVSQILLSAAHSGSSSPMLEDLNALVLSCAESVGLEVCSSLQRVMTTNGYSLAFTREKSADILVDSPSNNQFIRNLLDQDLKV